MIELIIENDNFNVLIKRKVNEVNEVNELDASIDVFDTDNEIFNLMLNAYYTENNFSLDYCITFFRLWYGIPKHIIEYKNLDISGIVNFKTYDLINLPNDNVIKKNIKEVEKHLKHKDIMTTTYYCDNKEDIAIACIYHFIKFGRTLNRCKNCGKYFIPTKRSDEKYCDRKNVNNKSCKEIKKYEKQKVNESSEIFKLRKNAYYTIMKQVERAKNDDDKKNAYSKLDILQKQYPKWKERLKTNKTTMNEYKKWIGSFYIRNGKYNSKKK